MKIFLLICMMLSHVAWAKDFDVKIVLGKHNVKNPYGEWSIDLKRATDKKYYGKIDTTESWGNRYHRLENTDMEILNIPYYKKIFIGQKYYKFYWRKKGNKGYFDNNADKINATISSIPPVKLRIKNLHGSSVTLLSLQSKNIFQTGGMADFIAGHIAPQIKEGAMELSYDKTDKMTFPKDYLMSSTKVLDLPLSLWVKNAAHGDGSGELTYALEMHYIQDGKRKTEVLIILSQSDAEGYSSGGAIAPIN